MSCRFRSSQRETASLLMRSAAKAGVSQISQGETRAYRSAQKLPATEIRKPPFVHRLHAFLEIVRRAQPGLLEELVMCRGDELDFQIALKCRPRCLHSE